MTGALIDTSLLIQQPDEKGLPTSSAISVISLGELQAGVRLARTGELAAARRARLSAIRSAYLALVVDDAVAREYGDILALARSERRIIKVTDLLIIATAASSGRELYTADVAQARLAEVAGVPTTGL